VTRRIALVTDANTHLGPELARELARREHELVLGDPTDGLVSELEEQGASIEVVRDVSDLTDPSSIESLVGAALDR